MTNVSKGPDPRNGEYVDGNWKKDDVTTNQDQDVEKPKAATVHVVSVGVLVAIATHHHHSHDLTLLAKQFLLSNIKNNALTV